VLVQKGIVHAVRDGLLQRSADQKVYQEVLQSKSRDCTNVNMGRTSRCLNTACVHPSHTAPLGNERDGDAKTVTPFLFHVQACSFSTDQQATASFSISWLVQDTCFRTVYTAGFTGVNGTGLGAAAAAAGASNADLSVKKFSIPVRSSVTTKPIRWFRDS